MHLNSLRKGKGGGKNEKGNGLRSSERACPDWVIRGIFSNFPGSCKKAHLEAKKGIHSGKVCASFLSGYCKFGENCIFSHDRSQKNAVSPSKKSVQSRTDGNDKSPSIGCLTLADLNDSHTFPDDVKELD